MQTESIAQRLPQAGEERKAEQDLQRPDGIDHTVGNDQSVVLREHLHGGCGGDELVDAEQQEKRAETQAQDE